MIALIKNLNLALFVILIIISCDELTYSLEEENNVEIEQPTFNDVKINLLSPTDTLGIWGETILRYQLDLEKKSFSHVQIYIDDNLVVNTSNKEEAIMDSRGFEDGVHLLRFEIYVFTNNNSLADRLRLEMALVYKNIPIIIDKESCFLMSLSYFLDILSQNEIFIITPLFSVDRKVPLRNPNYDFPALVVGSPSPTHADIDPSYTDTFSFPAIKWTIAFTVAAMPPPQ